MMRMTKNDRSGALGLKMVGARSIASAPLQVAVGDPADHRSRRQNIPSVGRRALVSVVPIVYSSGV